MNKQLILNQKKYLDNQPVNLQESLTMQASLLSNISLRVRRILEHYNRILSEQTEEQLQQYCDKLIELFAQVEQIPCYIPEQNQQIFSYCYHGWYDNQLQQQNKGDKPSKKPQLQQADEDLLVDRERVDTIVMNQASWEQQSKQQMYDQIQKEGGITPFYKTILGDTKTQCVRNTLSIAQLQHKKQVFKVFSQNLRDKQLIGKDENYFVVTDQYYNNLTKKDKLEDYEEEIFKQVQNAIKANTFDVDYICITDQNIKEWKERYSIQ